ncbi:MAG: PilW family protein [Terriglobia bacterium]
MNTIRPCTNPNRVSGNVICSESSGFSLIELIVAMAVFLIIAGAAFDLFSRQQAQFHQQEGDAGLNIGLRNAITKLELDLANAGTGYYMGANIPGFPVGVTLVNNPTGAGCNPTHSTTYTAACFDTLNIIAVNSSVAPIHADGPGGCSSTTSSTIFADAAPGLSLSETAANYSSGDQILLVTGNGSRISSFILTSGGSVSGNYVALEHNASNSDGTNSSSDDPLGITTHDNSKLGVTFCASDWVLKLAPITYQADASDPNDPKLVRVQGGNTVTVMDQVIGFRAGATLWNSATQTTSETYNYDASTYDDGTNPDAYDFTLIRSLRISLIARTKPSVDPKYVFRNTFDQGRYQVQGVSVVVNPRNLSMND